MCFLAYSSIISYPPSPVFGDDVRISCTLVTSIGFLQVQSYYRVGDSRVLLPYVIDQTTGSEGE